MPNITNHDWELLQTIWDYMVADDELPPRADAIVVGGSGMLTDSALRTAELYRNGIAPVIIVSGFANILDFGPTARNEADVLADVLVEQGVPSEAILREREATNTGDNIVNSVAVLARANIAAKNIILVHKPYMTRRFLATALAQWPQPQPKLHVTSWPTTLREYHRFNADLYGDGGARMICLMLGDYERIKSYPAKGFSATQPQSPEADAAFEELVGRGLKAKEMNS